MHQPDQLRTLIACIDDLTRTVESLHAQGEVHRADQDLLLYHVRLLYEALLNLHVGKAEAPDIRSAPVHKATTEINTQPPFGPVEKLEDAIETAEGEARASGDSIEMAQERQVEAEVASASASMVEAPDATTRLEHPVIAGKNDEQPVIAASEAKLPESEPKPETIAESTVVSPKSSISDGQAMPHRSVAFSLTGIIERSGDSQLVMAHLKLKPIEDLKSGIGLNEKFLFIRELFNNDHLAYAEAIEKLNAAKNLEEAEKIMGEQLLTLHEWDLETEAAMSFLHLVFRRFSSGH